MFRGADCGCRSPVCMYTSIILTDITAVCMYMTVIYVCRGVICMRISAIYAEMIPVCVYVGVECRGGSVECGRRGAERVLFGEDCGV